MLAIQAPQVDALVATFNTNAAGVAGCNTQNEIQNFNLMDLNSRIQALKVKLTGPTDPVDEDLAAVLAGYMMALQDIKDLVDEIAAEEAETAAIKVLIDANVAANAVLGPSGSIATLVTAAGTAATDFGDVVTAITDAGTAIDQNATDQMTNDTDAAALKVALDMQAIESDYYATN